MDRREFITNSLASAGLVTILSQTSETYAQSPERKENMPNRSPVILSTWDFGMQANEAGFKKLQEGGTALDAVEAAAIVTENDPKITSVGFGGFPNERGVVQLDAAIIDGKTGRMGAVGALEQVKNPSSVARKIMEAGKHIFLVGDGAQKYAVEQGFPLQNLNTSENLKWYTEQLEERRKSDKEHDTIGVLALDGNGDMAVCCTTSGLGMKWQGRVGDSPIIGAGLYLDQEFGGAVGTGVGERAIEVCAAFTIVELMRNGKTPQEACEELIRRVSKRNQGKPEFQLAFIALSPEGETGAASMQTGFQYALHQEGKNQLLTGKVYKQDFE